MEDVIKTLEEYNGKRKHYCKKKPRKPKPYSVYGYGINIYETEELVSLEELIKEMVDHLS